MPGNFFDLPQDQTCRHPEHFAPTHLYIPQGKGWHHLHRVQRRHLSGGLEWLLHIPPVQQMPPCAV